MKNDFEKHPEIDEKTQTYIAETSIFKE